MQRAALLVRQVQHELVLPALSKDDHPPVTAADYTAQALAAGLLERSFPMDIMVGEESSATLRQPEGQEMLDLVTSYVRQELPDASPEQVCNWIDRGQGKPGLRYWVLDPVDGTKGFLRGGQYAVALSLIKDNQVILALLGCPNLADGWKESQEGPGTLVIAQKGRGTWISSLEETSWKPNCFSQASVSNQPDPHQARLLRSYEASHTNAAKIETLMQHMNIVAPAMRLDSQAKYSILAAGRSEVIIRVPPADNPGYSEKVWDIAAGALVVEEAGGQTSDLDGQPLDYSTGRLLSSNRGILVTNGAVHKAFLKALNELKI
jgi:3'(2'), 5'-bisphosphate nucleotidase